MGGDRIAAEGIQHQHVIRFILLAFQDQSAIACDTFDLRSRLIEETKMLLGQFDDVRIDFNKIAMVAGTAIGSQHTASQSDATKSQRTALADRSQYASDSAVWAVVDGRLPCVLTWQLQAMQRPAVHHALAITEVDDPQHAEKAAIRRQHI